ncbi:hypothetical protein ATY81_06795 [Rhizobium sp. R72]|uniref:hypothetical protein n=1 Tax=unclassified Rhizobium TaxID=2613769 RepID=UPI000B52BD47|nr:MULTISPECIES: hypothetical protein [unclassified Rhizobium]OWW00939.1 hypothetical protein ATY81_06795 [Rhizobium sp. R72]OWW01318.1 hypothetical protein ATY80_06795 [Rhizobium sp. R711]
MADQKDSIGSKSRTSVLKYLRDIGDDQAVEELQSTGGSGQGITALWGSQVWGYTGMLCGFLPPEPGSKISTIESAMTLAPDESLKNSRVKVTLEKFWVHRYPGFGTHKILCEFTGKNQLQGEPEELRFALTTEAKDVASAAISGSPIFLGVSVGENGIAFEGKTINISSDVDDTILDAIGSGPFKEGLGLLTKAQPALKPFVSLTSSVVQSVLRRSKNKQVFNFKLGLDFAVSQTSVPLRIGSFVVVQGDASQWNWETVVWNPSSAQVVDKSTKEPIPFNYIVFRVSEYT